jgi:hypothetical protein
MEERLENVCTSIIQNRGLSKLEYDHLIKEISQNRSEIRGVEVNLRAIMLHHGIEYIETRVKFAENLSMNLQPCFQVNHYTVES